MEWQKNLYHHEENPPENAWEQIASQLEVQPWNLRKNLVDDEVLPPPAAWNNISAQLETENPFQEESKIIPFWRKPAGAVAAAAVGVLILLSAYYFLARKDLIRATDIAASVIDSPKKPAGSKTSEKKTAITEPAKKENESQPEKERSNNLPKRHEPIVVAASEANPKRTYSPHPFAVQSVERYPKSAQYSYNINTLNRNINAANRNITAFQKGMNPPYVIVQNEDGQLVRVSSKLKDIIYYMPSADQDYNDTDLPVSEIDYWKKMFSDWKKKADHSGYIPDSGNFFDIIGFIKMLQENN